MKYFTPGEFACFHCGDNITSQKLMDMADDAREIAGFPFIITSGYRCKVKNERVGGVKGSAHTKGLAFDIAIRSSSERYRAIEALMQVGFRRIGNSSRFLHADIDEDKPQNVMWGYKDTL